MSDELQWETISYSDEGEVVFIEVIPSEGHVEGKDCWCEPELMMDCEECEVGQDDCWQCDGRGLVEWERWSGSVPVAIHRDDRLD